ncbi:superoxide dismutase family protein [Bacillus sp. mrc49]|uniref:superoxide dismutase family protein n=1 Tax=Bacillus sp. mrc49 TaxID=2054913 RepID=UPI0012FD4CBB|nr:superoxide dismutase family protein [Bacillus sp. mrc49]
MNYKRKLVLPLCAAFLLYGCNAANDSNQGDKNVEDMNTIGQGTQTDADPQVKAEVKDVEGKTLGTVNFTEEGNAVLIQTALEGLEPGYHGFHIHENAICEAEAKDGPFTTAGGHFNPTDETHSHHAGDMPPLFVKEDGTAKFTATLDNMSIDQLKKEELAVIVHANPDNFANIPDRYEANGQEGPDEDTLKTGDAGDRQACGIIVSAEEK